MSRRVGQPLALGHQHHHHDEPGTANSARQPATPGSNSRRTTKHITPLEPFVFPDKTALGKKRSLQVLSSYADPPPPKPRQSMDDAASVDVGDVVEVPGGMTGTVRYVGGVKGKSGTFAGVELSKEWAARGKNDGDVDGVRYFTTTVPNSGIFLPSHRAIKVPSPTLTGSSFPPTPTTPGFQKLDLNAKSSQTPPTPSVLPKFSQSTGPGGRPATFSQSVGPGARPTSPQLKAKSRNSLPRPESPLRRNGSNLAAPSPRPSSRTMPRPSASPAPPRTVPKPSTPSVRSSSRSQSRTQDRSPDPDSTPTAIGRPSLGASRIASNNRAGVAKDEEVSKLSKKLDERDKQLKEQAASLADMENSLAELQKMMAVTEANTNNPKPARGGSGDIADTADVAQLRAILREKNDKIAQLTTEFDSHRADFRSTIDTLEMASTETERVYEKRVRELLQEVEELQSRGSDVETVALQLKQLEDLVQELEEGLEDARRGEAEARSEVEFLCGEVERLRLELRREREKGARALKGAGDAIEGGGGPSSTKDLEQRDDEIRGLKAIIHSLSSGPDMPSPAPDQIPDTNPPDEELARLRDAVDALQREKSELQGLVDRKKYREEELERENARLRDDHRSSPPSSYRSLDAHMHSKNSSVSTMTAVTANANRQSNTSTATAATAVRPASGHKRGESAAGALAALSEAESASPLYLHPNGQHDRDLDDAVSATTADTDTLWCELCETAGHDILTCTQMFGGEKKADDDEAEFEDAEEAQEHVRRDGADDTVVADSAPPPRTASLAAPKASPRASPPKPSPPAESADPFGPAPGKKTGVVDMAKWCAMCERDGHDSVDCPFEDTY